MNGLPLRDPEPTPNAHGFVSRPRPTARQFGTVIGLPARLAEWARDLGRDRRFPWCGLGLIEDIQVTVNLLNLREFAEWLRVHGKPEHADFANEILLNEETVAATYTAVDTADRVHGDVPEDPPRAVETLSDRLADAQRDYKRVRDALVEVGALADDDEETPVADLIRALLS